MNISDEYILTGLMVASYRAVIRGIVNPKLLHTNHVIALWQYGDWKLL